jgi:hypothetical protein
MKNPLLKFILFFLFAPFFLSCEKEIDLKLLPVVSTSKVSSVSYYSAQSGGSISADGGYTVVARGVCWSTSPNPTISNSKTVDAAGTGEYVSSIDSLLPNTTYYARAYATNSKGTFYGLQESFTTKPLTLSELTTSYITEITTTSAKTGGSISNDGGTPIISRGVCYSTSPNPTVNDSITKDGSGSGDFDSSLSGLKSGTVYYVRAYAENAQGASYGNEFQFMTQTAIAAATTAPITSITSSSAISGGEVLHDGGADVIARGVCEQIAISYHTQ